MISPSLQPPMFVNNFRNMLTHLIFIQYDEKTTITMNQSTESTYNLEEGKCMVETCTLMFDKFRKVSSKINESVSRNFGTLTMKWSRGRAISYF